MKTLWSMDTLKLLPASPANVAVTVRPLSQARVRVNVFGLLLPGSATAGAVSSRSPHATRLMMRARRSMVTVTPFVGFGNDPLATSGARQDAARAVTFAWVDGTGLGGGRARTPWWASVRECPLTDLGGDRRSHASSLCHQPRVRRRRGFPP